MSLQELIAYLEAHFKDSKEAKDLIEKIKDGITITLEQAQAFLTTDPEAVKWVAAERDRAVSKGITTYESNTLPKKIEEATKGLEKAPTETEKRIRELESTNASRDEKEKSLVLENFAIKSLTEKNLPASLAKRMIGSDEEDTGNNITLLEAEIKLVVDKQVGERLKKVGHTPIDENDDTTTEENPWHKDSFNLTKQALMINKDLDKAKRLAKEVGVTLKL